VHALRDAGDRAEAERAARALVAEAPAYADAALVLASLQVEAGDLRGAVSLLARVVRTDPSHADAIAALACVLFDGGRLDDAGRAVARARRLDPEHALALAVEGDCRLAAGDRPGAVARWRHVLSLEPIGDGARRARAALRAAGATP
jgi:Flp pilus assembly protein TadD